MENENVEQAELTKTESEELSLANDERIAEDENATGDSIAFEDLGLDEITLAAVAKKGFVHPSPIQVLAIPRLLNGDANVIARARTGTGKTAAFGLPLVQRLRNESDHVRAIILEPTRELAMQTCTEMASFTTGMYPRVAVMYGGSSYREQERALRRGVEIVVGTPGRIQDWIDKGELDISRIDYFILDEGDELLDMGFVEDIENIFTSANPNCRVLFFSATVPKPILRIADEFMGDYEIVEEEGHEEEPLLIEQKYWVVKESDKVEALVRLIDISPDFYGLVFVQKKTDADMVSKCLDERGYMVAALHGDIPQTQREKILARFRAKRVKVLVATDVAARGIDIGGLTHVVNFDLPFDGPTYVHRIGRTGRAGATGMAVTFVRPEESRRKLTYLKNAVKRSAKGEMTEGEVPSVEKILEVKKERLVEKVKSSMFRFFPAEEGEGEEKPKTDAVFELLASEICEGRDAKEVVAVLLAASYGKELKKDRYGKITDFSKRERGKDRLAQRERERSRSGAFAEDKGRSRERFSREGVRAGENQIRLYVQMGWDDGYNPRRIAEYFGSLLKIREREVDAIDMSDRFCLLSLPKDAGERALELSRTDSSVPHIHVDTKSISDGSSFSKRDSFSSRRRREDREESRGYFAGRYDFGERRDRGRRDGFRSSRAKGGSNARPGVHTATQRSGGGFASLYKKGGAEEY